MKKIVFEGLVVGMTGIALAFAANALSPRGLKLTRDYFPDSISPVRMGVAATNPPVVVGTNSSPEFQELAARLRAKGLQVLDTERAIELFHDPRRAQNLIVFVDARDDTHYQEGHIPGAYQFDNYHPENYIPAILPLSPITQEFVVYCKGGKCEDSEFAAIALNRDLGIAAEKLFVYAGGITEWRAKGLPIETGARNSGQVSNATP